LFRESLNYFEVIGIVLAVASLVLLMRFAEACLDSVAFDFHKQVFDVEWRMNSKQIAVILKSFDAPDEVRVMQKGKFELVQIGGMVIGRATYEPGWKWSEHVGPSIGATRWSR